jgi:3-dehydroquinate synthase
LSRLIALAGLPVEPPRLPVPRWLELMGRDKKFAHGQLRLVLLRAIGDAVITADNDPAALESFLARWAADAATGRSRASDRQ